MCMTVFETIIVGDKDIMCKAYLNNNKGPGVKLNVAREESLTDVYSEHMIVDKDVWYLSTAVEKGLISNGCNCTITDGAPDRFDESYVKVTGGQLNQKAGMLNAASLMSGE